MDKENRGNAYRQRNSDSGKKNFNSSKITTNKTVDDKPRECCNYEDDNTQLRESVLNKLWDSVPPEAQILPNPESDYSDSDETESGLDQEDDNYDEDDQDEENVGESQNSETIYRSPCSSRRGSSFRQSEDPKSSWEVNFDFIQAIIWLKSMIKKLQRIPASEFCKAFKNQWGLSRKIMSNHPTICAPKAPKTLAANASPIFRRPLNPANRSFSPPIQQIAKNIEGNQGERLELLKYRLATGLHDLPTSPREDLIPETDESELASVSSVTSQCFLPKIRGSEEPTEHHSNFDSGFNSEKPESMDLVNVCNAAEKIDNRTATRMKMSNRNLATIEEPMETNSAQLSLKNLPRVAVAQTGRTISNKRRYEEILISTPKRKSLNRSRASISSAMLEYVLRGSECNQLLFRSIRAILSVLKYEKSASSFAEWHSSVHKEAIEAIVSVIDQLDKEKGPDLCRREVVSMIEQLLKKMLRSDELDKAEIWEHHRSVVLELCNALSVCIGVVDYLIEELKNLIPAATETLTDGNNDNFQESVNSLQKSTMIFHSLNIVLKKYRVLLPSSVNADAAEEPPEKIPEVTELWQRDSNVTRRAPDVFVVGLTRSKRSLEDRERSWIKVLEELAVVSTTYWPLVKVLAWECLSVLKTARDG